MSFGHLMNTEWALGTGLLGWVSPSCGYNITLQGSGNTQEQSCRVINLPSKEVGLAIVIQF